MKAYANTTAWVIFGAATILLGAFLWTSAAESKPAKEGKLCHIGLVWLKDPGNAEQRQKIIESAHSFAKEIPEVESLSVGQAVSQKSSYVDSSFDVCLVMRFQDKQAMERYGANPVHQKAAHEIFLPLSSKILFYDFIAE